MAKIKLYAVSLGADGNVDALTVTNHTIARAISWEDYGEILSNKLNGSGGDGRKAGIAFGAEISTDHPTLQRLAIEFLLNSICEIAKKQYTDDRNVTAIVTCKKIAEMIEAGDLPIGAYI